MSSNLTKYALEHRYFQILLKKGRLNKLESIELARPVVKQGKTPLLTKWITENKLEPSAELGDLVSQLDVKIAVRIYKEVRLRLKISLIFPFLDGQNMDMMSLFYTFARQYERIYKFVDSKTFAYALIPLLFSRREES